MEYSCETVLHFKDYCVKEQSRESSDKEGISKNLLRQASAEPTASEVELLLGEKQLPLSKAKTRNL